MTYYLNDQAVNLIKKFEGLSYKSYKCPAGYNTVGYGHKYDDENPELEVIDEETADALLMADLKIAENAVLRNVKVPLSLNQYGALVSFVFNVGAGAFQRSTLKQKVNRGETVAVPQEFMRWTKVHGRVLRGLLNRRRAEAELYLG